MSREKDKGNRGEREVAMLFGGGAARAPLSHVGGGDIVFPVGHPWRGWLVEVKRAKRLGAIRLNEALDQAARAARNSRERGYRRPAVVFREDHGDWKFLCAADDIISFVETLVTESPTSLALREQVKILIEQIKEMDEQIEEMKREQEEEEAVDPGLARDEDALRQAQRERRWSRWGIM